LAALTPPNRLALEISMKTGLRIGDVLNLKTEALRGVSEQRLTIKEQKTGKSRRIRIPLELYEEAMKKAGRYFIFENRLDQRRPRTRQAVYKDLKRVAKLFRLKENIAPHSARKVYAVEAFARTGDIKRVQSLLNHKDEAITTLYAMADTLTARKLDKGK
jgi:integrase